MRKRSIETAKAVAAHLFSAEESIDAAVARTAELVAALPIARQQLHVSVAVGQDALDEAVASLTALSDARRRMARTHAALAQAAASAGVPETNFGGFVDKPCHRASADQTAKDVPEPA